MKKLFLSLFVIALAGVATFSQATPLSPEERYSLIQRKTSQEAFDANTPDEDITQLLLEDMAHYRKSMSETRKNSDVDDRMVELSEKVACVQSKLEEEGYAPIFCVNDTIFFYEIMAKIGSLSSDEEEETSYHGDILESIFTDMESVTGYILKARQFDYNLIKKGLYFKKEYYWETNKFEAGNLDRLALKHSKHSTRMVLTELQRYFLPKLIRLCAVSDTGIVSVPLMNRASDFIGQNGEAYCVQFLAVPTNITNDYDAQRSQPPHDVFHHDRAHIYFNNLQNRKVWRNELTWSSWRNFVYDKIEETSGEERQLLELGYFMLTHENFHTRNLNPLSWQEAIEYYTLELTRTIENGFQSTFKRFEFKDTHKYEELFYLEGSSLVDMAESLGLTCEGETDKDRVHSFLQWELRAISKIKELIESHLTELDAIATRVTEQTLAFKEVVPGKEGVWSVYPALDKEVILKNLSNLIRWPINLGRFLPPTFDPEKYVSEALLEEDLEFKE